MYLGLFGIKKRVFALLVLAVCSLLSFSVLAVDSDNDGMDDAWEMTNFGNLNQTVTGDYDHDGATNLEEYQIVTNPASMDSDSDSFIDGYEIAEGTDPLDDTSIPGTSMMGMPFTEHNINVGVGINKPYWTDAIYINKIVYPLGFVTHPLPNGIGYIEFDISQDDLCFSVETAISDNQNDPNNPRNVGTAAFRVYADGQQCYSSNGLFFLNGASKLRLEVDSLGANWCDHCVWLDPKLIKASLFSVAAQANSISATSTLSQSEPAILIVPLNEGGVNIDLKAASGVIGSDEKLLPVKAGWTLTQKPAQATALSGNTTDVTQISYTAMLPGTYVFNAAKDEQEISIQVVVSEIDLDIYNENSGEWVADETEDDSKQNVAIMGTEQEPRYVKIRLNVGAVREGDIKFTVNGGMSNCEEVEVYTRIDGNLLKNWQANLENIPSGNDLKGLENGGTVELYLKLLKPGIVNARLEYIHDGNNSGSDSVSFKIVSACNCNSCPAGECNFLIGSVNSEIKLGSNNYGHSAGSIHLNAKDLTMDIANPKTLQILPGEGTEVSYNSNVTPSEINTGVYNVTFSYATETYAGKTYYRSNTMNFNRLSDSTLYRTVKITNNFQYLGDDQSGNPLFQINSLQFEEISGGATKTATYAKDSTGKWTLNKNGIDESMENTVSGNIRTETYRVGPSSSPDYQRVNEYQTFPWGEELIETTDSQTTTYEYYCDRDADGQVYGKLKKITYPKGKIIEYVYNQAGVLTGTLTYEGDNVYRTTRTLAQIVKINDVVTTVAMDAETGEFNYGDLSGTDTLAPCGSIEVTEEYCNDELTSKKENRSYSDYSYAPDQTIAYDENDTTYSDYTWKIDDEEDPFYGRTRLIKNYNGLVTTYAYSRTETQEIVTSCSGKPSDATTNCTVIDGTRTVTRTNKNGAVEYQATWDIASNTKLSEQTAVTYDDFGRVTKTLYMDGSTSEVRYGCCGIEWEKDREGIETTSAYDAAKRLSYTVRNGITTLYTYNANGDTVSTTTKGRNNTELTSSSVYVNGRQASSTDPMGYVTSYAYADNSDTVTFPNGATSVTSYNLGVVSGISGTGVFPISYAYGPNWSRTGSPDVTVYRDLLGRPIETVYADDSSGQTYYNAKGQAVKQVSPAGLVTLAEYDDVGRLKKSAIDMNKNDSIDSADIVTEYQYSYSTRNSKAVAVKTTIVSQGSDSKTVSVTENSVDGYDSWITADGRTNHTSVTYPTTRDGSKTVTEERYDGSKTVTTYQNGVVSKIENFNTDNSAGNTLDYTYDEFDRPATVVESFGAQTINTTATIYNANGQPTAVTVNGRSTTNAYDSMGRCISVTSPGNRTVNYEYYLTGKLSKVSGAETYAQEYEYDDQGSRTSLITYQDENNEEYTDYYYNVRGFMIEENDGEGYSTYYDYDADGRRISRTGASDVTASYAYDNAGRPTGTTYSDSTPGISYAYDFLSRVTAVTDGTGTHTFAYNNDSTIASETIPHIVNGTLEYAYDSSGRRTEMQLKQGGTAVFANNYTYDVQSRIASVSDGANTATHSRVAGTHLLNTTTITAGGSAKLTTARSYDSLYRMTSISSVSSAPSVVKTYSYTYDDKDRRSRLNMPDGSYWLYAYDAKGQIISGVKYASNDYPIPGQAFGYAYDGIGNLTSEQRGMAEMQFDYTSNMVNQYTQRTVPGIIPVTGQASTDSTISIWLKNHGENAAAVIKPTRNGEYFTSLISVDNSTANISEDLEITAVKFDATQDKDVVKTITGNYTVPQTPQFFEYDLDDNMTSNAIWSYAWNGANQLIAAEKAGEKKVEFAYDYMGRRTEKKVYAWVNNAWSLTVYLKFVYDGFKQIVEYDGTAETMQKNYTWQPEAAGQDVPLWMNTSGSTYYYVVDGNKNVGALVDGTGALVAEYEYGQFGEILSKYGPMSDVNPFRFSSEFFDAETGLIYFNYRYYSPDFRRWLSKDPIGEEGGMNLQCFVNNNPVCYVDGLGLKQVLFTLLLGPNGIGDYSERWKKIGDDYKRDGGKEDVCFETLKNVSATDVVKSAENGYGFLIAHGKLYYDGEDITSGGGNNGFKDLTDVVKYANVRAMSKAKRDYLNNYKGKNILSINEAIRNGQIKLNVPTVTENDIIVKMHLWDGDLMANEVLTAGLPGIKTLYSDRINFYGCYAGHLKPATDGGLTIGSGHNFESSLSQATGLGFILKDAEQKLLNLNHK